MKRIDASEQAFGQANRYYLLMWVLVTLVAATALWRESFSGARPERHPWQLSTTTRPSPKSRGRWR